MVEIKTKTLVYEGFGFPITLINTPLKKVFGEWVLNINLNRLRLSVLYCLIHKPVPLTGAEIRFIRCFLEMSTVKFGKLFGVTHVAVVKWENNQTYINPATEFYMRLYILDHLQAKDREFRKLYNNVKIEELIKHKKDRDLPLKIDASEDQLLAC